MSLFYVSVRRKDGSFYNLKTRSSGTRPASKVTASQQKIFICDNRVPGQGSEATKELNFYLKQLISDGNL